MRSTARRTSGLLRNWLVFLLATVPAAGVATAGGGPCFSVSIAEAVKLPGGELYDPGSLRVCVTHRLSPVSAVHKVYVNDRHVAMLVSRIGTGEATGDGSAVMMFQRDFDGRLRLHGFAAPDYGTMTNYLLSGEGFTGGKPRKAARLQTTFARDRDDEVVLVAARDSRR